MRDFILNFTKEQIINEKNILQLRSDFYLVSEGLMKTLKQTGHIPCFAGIYLGRKKKNFVPSSYLLKKLAETSKSKIIVNDKGAWMFICGRHIYAESVVKFNPEQKINDFVLVMNRYNECLGYGRMINRFDSKKVAIQTIFDIGDFVRRERKK